MNINNKPQHLTYTSMRDLAYDFLNSMLLTRNADVLNVSCVVTTMVN